MRRAILVLSSILLAGLTAMTACGFDDVTYADDVPETGTGPGDSTTGDASVDSPKGPDAPVGANEDVDPDGGNADATTAPDSQRIDAGGPDAQCCDCDLDKFKSSGACDAAPGDCDDLNPFVHKGQGFVNSSAWDTDHQPAYDWDCNDTVVKQYPYGRAVCANQLKLSLGGCAQFQGGFQGNPGCGVEGHYVTSCIADTNVLNLKCTETWEPRKQGCH